MGKWREIDGVSLDGGVKGDSCEGDVRCGRRVSVGVHVDVHWGTTCEICMYKQTKKKQDRQVQNTK